MSMQAGKLDELAEKLFGISGETLMDNAATALAENIKRKIPQDKTVGIFCGRGKNGGDGFLLACKLSDAGYKVKAVLCFERGDRVNPLTQNAMELASQKCIPVLSLDNFQGADVYIDAVLGTGFAGDIGGLYLLFKSLPILKRTVRIWRI